MGLHSGATVCFWLWEDVTKHVLVGVHLGPEGGLGKRWIFPAEECMWQAGPSVPEKGQPLESTGGVSLDQCHSHTDGHISMT